MSCSVCAGYISYNCPCCGEEPRMITCPDCHGSGHMPYMALDVIKRVCIPVTDLAWQVLPDDEDMANYLGMRFCKMEIELCPRCRGEGEITE